MVSARIAKMAGRTWTRRGKMPVPVIRSADTVGPQEGCGFRVVKAALQVVDQVQCAGGARPCAGTRTLRVMEYAVLPVIGGALCEGCSMPHVSLLP